MYLVVHTAMFTGFLCCGTMYHVMHTATYIVFLFLMFCIYYFDGGVMVIVLK